MRIGIFSDSYYPHISGVSTSVEMLRKALESMGHSVYIVAPNLDNRKFIYDKDNKVIYLPGIKIGLYKLRLAETYSRKAMKIIKDEWHLDIIHTQTEFTTSHFGRTVARKLHLPVVHTYHTMYEDYVYYITHGHFEKFAKKMVVKIVSNYCNNKCDALIVPTEKIKNLFKTYNIKKEINVIPTGIDLDRFYPTKTLTKKCDDLRKKLKINKDDFVIGAVGRIASEKSFDRIINNLPELVKYNNKIKLVLVGDGPEMDNLKELAKKLNLKKNIIFTGLVDYDIVPIYYQLFDVMVSFSTTETQGLTIIEALAASIPVVCIDDPSFNTTITSGYNGYLFTKDEEYLKYILDLAYNKTLYKEMSMNAHNSVYSYSKEVFASNVLKVYHDVIKKNKS